MKVLLISMPDAVSSLKAVMEIPNLGICSLAGNLDGCDTRVLDLALCRGRLTPLIQKTMREFDPDIVGISAMSFQYASARRVALICKLIKPGALTVLGGYHATLLAEQVGESDDRELFDFIVRGEGEATLNALVQELRAGGKGVSRLKGLSYLSGLGYTHNPPSDLLLLESLRLPDRDCRILDHSQFFNLAFDCVETSRGCTLACTFCSIRQMYGRCIRFFSLDRVIEDLRRIKSRGTRGVFFVDDNITLDTERLKELARRIIGEKLDTLFYVMQASVTGTSSDPELAQLLARANVRWVFLGVESGTARNLARMRKPRSPDSAREAVSLLRRQGISVIGGFIVGDPEDTRRDVSETYRYGRRIGLDHVIVQVLTPYPKTEIREELLAQGLITNINDYSRYNGFISNIRTRHLSSAQLNRSVVLSGIRLYFNPLYLMHNRVWWHRPADVPQMLLNNLRFVASGLKGSLFASTHIW